MPRVSIETIEGKEVGVIRPDSDDGFFTVGLPAARERRTTPHIVTSPPPKNPVVEECLQATERPGVYDIRKDMKYSAPTVDHNGEPQDTAFHFWGSMEIEVIEVAPVPLAE